MRHDHWQGCPTAQDTKVGMSGLHVWRFEFTVANGGVTMVEMTLYSGKVFEFDAWFWWVWE
jgi:hypothetical protein